MTVKYCRRESIYASPCGSVVHLLSSLIMLMPGDDRVLYNFPTDIGGGLHFIKHLLARENSIPFEGLYPLKKITEACKYVGSGEKIGNAVLTLD